MAFKTVYSESVYKGRAFQVRRDQVELPTGKVTALDIVDHPGAVTIVPVDQRGQIWFVRQFRYAAGKSLLELPAGTLEKDESPDECAFREVREETGMSAGRMQKLGEFYMAPGYSTEFMHVFLATDLKPDPLQKDEDEFIGVEQIPLAQAMKMAEKGQLQDGKSLAALFLAQPLLTGTGRPLRSQE